MKKVNPSVFSKVVTEGVGKEYFAIKQKKGRYILYLGRFDINQKGLDFLLEAYSKIADKISYPLIIAGHGNDKQKIKGLINKWKLTDKVFIKGPSYEQKKYKLLSEALYVVMPSRHEGFSLFALEALASGLPLIIFSIPGLSWVSPKVSLIAKAFDIKKYSQNMKKATNHRIIENMRKNAREFARRFSWDSVTEKYESFFYQVLKKENYES